jgi:hypothetical protein
VARVKHRQGHCPEKICKTSEGVSWHVFGKGEGIVGRVSLTLWLSVPGIYPFFSGRFLRREMKISLQGSSTKQHVIAALISRFHPKRKESQCTMNFPAACVIVRLIHI